MRSVYVFVVRVCGRLLGVCVRAFMRGCVRACLCVCVIGNARTSGDDAAVTAT